MLGRGANPQFPPVATPLNALKCCLYGINFIFKANDWVKLFLKVSSKDKEEGYSNESITLYMHLLAYHVPRFLCDENGIKIFTGQVKTNVVSVGSAIHKQDISLPNIYNRTSTLGTSQAGTGHY